MKHGNGRRIAGVVIARTLTLAPALMTGPILAADLPPAPAPAENPVTESKRVLGKILFWEEQLSSDNSMACGTCHRPSFAGSDPRILINPGLDGANGTPDDKRASPGVIAQNAADEYEVNAVFGLGPQVTDRAANVVVNAAFSPELFWDGRATSEFVDPQTGQVSIVAGGALESQSVAPPVNDGEMAHAERDWTQISQKLETSRPLALATDLPADVAAAMGSSPSYPDLFAAAFGDGQITAERIAFALATYERTLISDRTPWDDFIAGDASALSVDELAGWNAFRQSGCVVCHTPPMFTDHQFHNLGLRPIAEDDGRFGVTQDPADLGRFKTASVRNVGLKRSFMHTGQFVNVGQAVGSYAGPPAFPQNVDPARIAVNLPPNAAQVITTFLQTGLLDDRVESEIFPFDRPTLRSERPANPRLLGGGVVGGAGAVPQIVASSPPSLGNTGFKLGVGSVLEGEQVTLHVSSSSPVNGVIAADEQIGPLTAQPGAGVGPVATAFWPIPADEAMDGRVVYFQWVTASGGRSRVAEATLFCGDCAAPCLADLTGDGLADNGDIFVFLGYFLGQNAQADLNGDGIVDNGDVGVFVEAFLAGC